MGRHRTAELLGGVGWQSAENDVVLKIEFEHGFGFRTIPDFNINLVRFTRLSRTGNIIGLINAH